MVKSNYKCSSIKGKEVFIMKRSWIKPSGSIFDNQMLCWGKKVKI